MTPNIRTVAFAALAALGGLGQAQAAGDRSASDALVVLSAASGAAAANVAALQAAINAAAAANAGVVLPCGVFRLNAALTVTIAAGGSTSIASQAHQNCTTLVWAPGSDGFDVAEQSQTANFSMHGVSLLTQDTSGARAALNIAQTHTVSYSRHNAFGMNALDHIVMRGFDPDHTGLPYWGVGINGTNIWNTNITGGGYFGKSPNNNSLAGTAIFLQGRASPASYATQMNVSGFLAQGCGIGFYYGDYVQGVTITGGTNFTGCLRGVVATANPAGTPDQLVISDSQIACYQACIDVTAMNGLQIHHNTLIVYGGAGIITGGNQTTIDHNFLQNHGGESGVVVKTGEVNGLQIDHNFFQFFPVAIAIASGKYDIGSAQDNSFVKNKANYAITPGTLGFQIDDANTYSAANIGSLIPACSKQLTGSQFRFNDSSVTTFMGAYAGGGNAHVTGRCNGAVYQVH